MWEQQQLLAKQSLTWVTLSSGGVRDKEQVPALRCFLSLSHNKQRTEVGAGLRFTVETQHTRKQDGNLCRTLSEASDELSAE